MPKILSRCQKALETQMIDMQISLNKHKSLMKKTFGISSTVGAMAALTSLAFASGNASVGDVATFGNQIGQALGNIYDTAFKVITAAAALAYCFWCPHGRKPAESSTSYGLDCTYHRLLYWFKLCRPDF